MNDIHDPAIELRHLRLVAAISAEGSLTAAARGLRLTQPALSHQLRDLEARLRTPLFVRASRRMVPTPAGEQLTHLALGILGQVRGFEQQALNGDFNAARGTIRLATECYTAYHWLPAVLRIFQDRWPGVELRIAPEHTSAPARALRDGALDLALVHRKTADRRLRFDPLFDDEQVVVVAPDHPWATRSFVPAEDFASEHLIIYMTADGTTSVTRDVLDAHGVTPARITRIQLTEAILELVGAGLGVSVLSRWAVAPAVRAGLVVAVRLTDTGFSRTWFTATRAHDPASPFHHDLVALLRKHVAGGPTIVEARSA